MPTPKQGEHYQELLSREALALRWGVSKETIKRKERAGLLPGLRFNSRLLRYRLADVLRVEAEASSRRPEPQPLPAASGGSSGQPQLRPSPRPGDH